MNIHTYIHMNIHTYIHMNILYLFIFISILNTKILLYCILRQSFSNFEKCRQYCVEKYNKVQICRWYNKHSAKSNFLVIFVSWFAVHANASLPIVLKFLRGLLSFFIFLFCFCNFCYICRILFQSFPICF